MRNDRPHHLTREQVLALLEERDTLREHVRQLEEALAPTFVLPASGRLTPVEEKLIAALRVVGPSVLHRERAMIAIYGMGEDAPGQKALDILLCKLRKKLAQTRTHIEIETVWGRGWRMSAESRARFDEAVRKDRARWDAPTRVAA
jgi:xanthine/CO dehydrogenase XdhC/CoxF family maturation factor